MEVTTKQILLVNRDQEFANNLKMYLKEFDLGVVHLSQVKEISILKNKFAGEMFLLLYVINSEYENYISDLSYLRTYDQNIKIITILPKYFSAQSVDEVLDLGVEEIMVSPLASLKLLYKKINLFYQINTSVSSDKLINNKLSSYEEQLNKKTNDDEICVISSKYEKNSKWDSMMSIK